MRKFAALFGIACLLLTVLTGCHKVSPEQEEISPEESQVQKVQRLSVPGFEKVEVNCPELLQEEASLPIEQILEEIPESYLNTEVLHRIRRFPLPETAPVRKME